MAGKLILTRKDGFFGANRRYRYKVFIDGAEVGEIKKDDTEEYALTPGSHTLQCKINWMTSPIETIYLNDGANAYFSVSSGMKFLLPLYLLLFTGAFLPFCFRQIIKIPVPAYMKNVQIILVAPCIIYLIFYMSVLRKKYLVISADNTNLYSINFI